MKTSSKFNIPNYEHLAGEIKEFIRQFAESLRRNHDDIFYDLSPKAIQLPVNVASPSVKNGHGKLFYTANTGGTAYTDFTDAEDGMKIVILCTDAFTSATDGGNFKLSANWTPNADDTIQLIFKSGVWYEVSRSTN